MKEIRYTPKARSSIKQIANYLLEQTQSKFFVKQHLEKFRTSLNELLTAFPESGVQIQLEEMTCRRVSSELFSALFSRNQ